MDLRESLLSVKVGIRLPFRKPFRTKRSYRTDSPIPHSVPYQYGTGYGTVDTIQEQMDVKKAATCSRPVLRTVLTPPYRTSPGRSTVRAALRTNIGKPHPYPKPCRADLRTLMTTCLTRTVSVPYRAQYGTEHGSNADLYSETPRT